MWLGRFAGKVWQTEETVKRVKFTTNTHQCGEYKGKTTANDAGDH